MLRQLGRALCLLGGVERCGADRHHRRLGGARGSHRLVDPVGTSSPSSGGRARSGRAQLSAVCGLASLIPSMYGGGLRIPALGASALAISRIAAVKTLVTGGAGFIGSNLVDALLASGDAVTVVNDLSTGRRSNLDGALAAGAELAELDIRDAEALAGRLAATAPDVVFHLAAQIDVRRSLADPAFDAAVNIGGTANLLEAMHRAGSRRIVFVSTGGAIYGEGEGKPLPLGEDAPIEPFSAYGQSKYAAEGYLALYERLYGISGISLRLGNVYGPRQDPLGEAGVIAIFCGKLRAGERPLVYGDGRQTRDYVYVGDVVKAALTAAESEACGPVNVGAGIETDVLELASRLAEIAGAEGFEPEFAPAREGEVLRIALDASRAERELGWRAETSVADGLRRTLDSI